MKKLLSVVVTSCILFPTTNQAATQAEINASIASYNGPCPCPYNTDSRGRACGERSAYSRPGGASPICYLSDPSPSSIYIKNDENIKKETEEGISTVSEATELQEKYEQYAYEQCLKRMSIRHSEAYVASVCICFVEEFTKVEPATYSRSNMTPLQYTKIVEKIFGDCHRKNLKYTAPFEEHYRNNY